MCTPKIIYSFQWDNRQKIKALTQSELIKRGRSRLFNVSRLGMDYFSGKFAPSQLVEERRMPNSSTVEVSVLQSDVVGFTQLLADYDLDLVTTSLETYMDKLSNVIQGGGGGIDKYLGDGVMAVYRDANEAVQAGYTIQQTVAEFNRKQALLGGPVFLTRIGIDSGKVMTTNLGSTPGQERTVIGLPVNLADRLQALAPPGQVWFSAATYQQLRSKEYYRYIGPVTVKGQSGPLAVYAIRTLDTHLGPQQK